MTSPDFIHPHTFDAQGRKQWGTIRCVDCGAAVQLRNVFTITCDACGADYNASGDRLAPREQWGEETGEHWMECY